MVYQHATEPLLKLEIAKCVHTRLTSEQRISYEQFEDRIECNAS